MLGLFDWIARSSLAGVAMIMLASMLLAALAGHAVRLIHSRLSPERKKPERSQESYLVGSMLGLLALLMAVNRYEERRQLVVDEANAIGTSYLRAQLLDEPHRSRLGGLLIQYTNNRIALANGDREQLPSRLAVNDRLLTEIWAAVTAARD